MAGLAMLSADYGSDVPLRIDADWTDMQLWDIESAADAARMADALERFVGHRRHAFTAEAHGDLRAARGYRADAATALRAHPELARLLGVRTA